MPFGSFLTGGRLLGAQSVVRYTVAGIFALVPVSTTAGDIATPKPVVQLQAMQPDYSSRTIIYGTGWGITLNTDGSGYFNELASLVMPPKPNLQVYEVQPYKRAIRRFISGRDSCLYPINTSFLKESKYVAPKTALIESRVIHTHHINLFSRPKTPPINSLADLEGKSIGYAMGTRIQTYLGETGASYFAVSEELDKAEMLLSGRLDVITAAMPDAKFVFKRLGSKLPPYRPEFSVRRSGLSVVCKDTPTNRLFLTALDKHIISLWETGAMANFMTKHDLLPQRYRPDWFSSGQAENSKPEVAVK